MTDQRPIVIFGAGAIGCYLGGCLAANGQSVKLIGRPWMQEELKAGLQVSDWQGRHQQAKPEHWQFSCDASDLANASAVLVTVKGAATPDAAAAIAQYAPIDALVVSFQNGIGNDQVLKSGVEQTVLAGMVPFNVAYQENGLFHCGTEGLLSIEKGDDRQSQLSAALEKAGLPTEVHADMLPVQWGKLLLNLNNPINALSGEPLKAQLENGGYRKVVAACLKEALTLLKRAGIKPKRTGKAIPSLLPWIMALPDPIFKRVAQSMLKVDPKATSSMADDLQRGRTTEIDFINGAVVRLAESLNLDAPVNRAVVAEIKRAEQAASGSPALSASELQAKVLS